MSDENEELMDAPIADAPMADSLIADHDAPIAAAPIAAAPIADAPISAARAAPLGAPLVASSSTTAAAAATMTLAAAGSAATRADRGTSRSSSAAVHPWTLDDCDEDDGFGDSHEGRPARRGSAQLGKARRYSTGRAGSVLKTRRRSSLVGEIQKLREQLHAQTAKTSKRKLPTRPRGPRVAASGTSSKAQARTSARNETSTT